jgi:hypothetical protein
MYRLGQAGGVLLVLAVMAVTFVGTAVIVGSWLAVVIETIALLRS